VGWASADRVMGPQELDCKKNWDVAKKLVEKVKEQTTHHQNIPAAAYFCWRVGDEGGRPNFSLWAELRLIAWWDRKNLIVKNDWDEAKKLVEKVKKLETHGKNIPPDAYCCWHVGDEGGRPNFSLWAEFRLIVWWDRNYLIVKKINET
jgi:hypothetical protein